MRDFWKVFRSYLKLICSWDFCVLTLLLVLFVIGYHSDPQDFLYAATSFGLSVDLIKGSFVGYAGFWFIHLLFRCINSASIALMSSKEVSSNDAH